MLNDLKNRFWRSHHRAFNTHALCNLTIKSAVSVDFLRMRADVVCASISARLASSCCCSALSSSSLCSAAKFLACKHCLCWFLALSSSWALIWRCCAFGCATSLWIRAVSERAKRWPFLTRSPSSRFNSAMVPIIQSQEIAAERLLYGRRTGAQPQQYGLS